MVSLFNKQALSASSVLDKVSDDRRYDLGLLLMISSAKLVAVVTGTKLHWCRHIKAKQKLEHGHSFQSGPVFAFFNQTTTTTKMSPSTSKAGGRCQSQNQSATGDNNNKSPTVHHHHHHQPTIPTAKNAERERSRVRSLRTAFQSLQACLPSVPPDTKLSKLDILILATNYIAQLMATLGDGHQPAQEEVSELGTDQSFPVVAIPPPPSCSSSSLQSTYYHPMKKWPMRSRLYSLVQLIATDKEIMGSSSSSASKMEVSTSEESSDFNNNNNESSSMIYHELHHHHHHQADFTCSDDMTSLFPLDLDDEAMMIRCAEGGGGSGSDC